MSNKLWVRDIRKLTDSGHQTPILTTNFQAPLTALAVSLFARRSQENFFRSMREHYRLDRLVEYGTEPVPNTISVVNPHWRKLDSQIRSKTSQRYRLAAQFGALALSQQPGESELQGYQQRKGQLQEQIQHLGLRTERKHFVDTIKMIGYRAETSLASLLREHLAHSDDGRVLLRQIFQNEGHLLPDSLTHTLTVGLHHFTQAAHDQAIAPLCATLNETQTVFPGTHLKLIFEIGSSKISPDQEV